jgi:hypothetical protein
MGLRAETASNGREDLARQELLGFTPLTHAERTMPKHGRT